MDNSLLTQVLIIFLVVVVLWVVLHFLLRLTAKIFACGCALIVLIGVAAFLYLWVKG